MRKIYVCVKVLFLYYTLLWHLWCSRSVESVYGNTQLVLRKVRRFFSVSPLMFMAVATVLFCLKFYGVKYILTNKMVLVINLSGVAT